MITAKVVVLQSTLGVAVLTGAVIYEAGAVRVDVREKSPQGEHIRLIVPAIVLPVGARLVPAEKLREASKELRPWLPAIQAASEELSRCPDGPFVEVDSPREHVRIAKVGGSLVIDVDSEEETVHLSVPIRTLAYTARQLVRDSNGPPV